MIIELTKHIKVIRPDGHPLFPNSNSLFIDDDIPTLIDSSSGISAYKEINTGKVQNVFLSHGHYDHNKDIGLFSAAKILGGIEDRDFYANSSNFYAPHMELWDNIMPIPFPKHDIPVNSKKQQSSLPISEIANMYDFSINISEFFSDGQVYNLGKTEMQVIHAPGHSPGHYLFYFDREGILFSSEIDFSTFGPWYADNSCHIDQFIDSINTIENIDPDILVNSHRKVYYRKDNIKKSVQEFLNFFARRDENIYNYLKVPHTFMEILEMQVSSEGIEAHDISRAFWVKAMTGRHIEHLQKQNLISEVEKDTWVRR